ncbi:oxidoreductase [Roseobacter sp. S98]|uniref:oxidoreductase n=1 Tax=Roseobacter algicola (ex Choi et al. 2025) (nom. illeg.) TaxID=3092138 RepID=UPI003F50FFEC
MSPDPSPLFTPLELPCGAVLSNRLAKAAMSDSLGDGMGNPTETQQRLYERWAAGGVALSIIGEVQGNPNFAEKPGNLVLTDDANPDPFRALAQKGAGPSTQLWLQLGHAGAMTHAPTGTPKGPSALDLEGLQCDAMTFAEVSALPDMFAGTARLSRELGFGGVEIHAAHGFLLSQFLSPLFNRRGDAYGGAVTNRMRLLLEVVEAVRSAVGPTFPVGVKLNATDQLEGGLIPTDALEVVAALEVSGVDLIDISGGTYFPGAASASHATASGVYFLDFAEAARTRTRIPLMVTGGFKTRDQAIDAVVSGKTDIVGLARSLVLDPHLPRRWQASDFPRSGDITFPRFNAPPEGGITAWYTMRMTELGQDSEGQDIDLPAAVKAYNERDAERTLLWRRRFGSGAGS